MTNLFHNGSNDVNFVFIFSYKSQSNIEEFDLRQAHIQSKKKLREYIILHEVYRNSARPAVIGRQHYPRKKCYRKNIRKLLMKQPQKSTKMSEGQVQRSPTNHKHQNPRNLSVCDNNYICSFIMSVENTSFLIFCKIHPR